MEMFLRRFHRTPTKYKSFEEDLDHALHEPLISRDDQEDVEQEEEEEEEDERESELEPQLYDHLLLKEKAPASLNGFHRRTKHGSSSGASKETTHRAFAVSVEPKFLRNSAAFASTTVASAMTSSLVSHERLGAFLCGTSSTLRKRRPTADSLEEIHKRALLLCIVVTLVASLGLILSVYSQSLTS